MRAAQPCCPRPTQGAVHGQADVQSSLPATRVHKLNTDPCQSRATSGYPEEAVSGTADEPGHPHTSPSAGFGAVRVHFLRAGKEPSSVKKRPFPSRWQGLVNTTLHLQWRSGPRVHLRTGRCCTCGLACGRRESRGQGDLEGWCNVVYLDHEAIT